MREEARASEKHHERNQVPSSTSPTYKKEYCFEHLVPTTYQLLSKLHLIPSPH